MTYMTFFLIELVINVVGYSWILVKLDLGRAVLTGYWGFFKHEYIFLHRYELGSPVVYRRVQGGRYQDPVGVHHHHHLRRREYHQSHPQ